MGTNFFNASICFKHGHASLSTGMVEVYLNSFVKSLTDGDQEANQAVHGNLSRACSSILSNPRSLACLSYIQFVVGSEKARVDFRFRKTVSVRDDYQTRIRLHGFQIEGQVMARKNGASSHLFRLSVRRDDRKPAPFGAVE